MQARAGAIDELLASGALDDPTGTSKDDIALELERMASTNDVELEMQRLRGELGAGEAPKQLEGQPASSPEAAPVRKAEEEQA
jgi:phage shock protein A